MLFTIVINATLLFNLYYPDIISALLPYNLYLFMLKPSSDERKNGFKGLKLKRCKFLQSFFNSCERNCFCLKTLKHFRLKCLMLRSQCSKLA